MTTTSNLDRQVGQRLQTHDIRYTRGRNRVVAALGTIDGPRSAAELHDLVSQDIPLSSLYRTLAILEETGVVTPHYSKSGVARYELAEWLRGHHHHLVCTECGSVEDVDLSPAQEKRIHKVVEDLATDASFHVADHVLEIEGRCDRCR